MIRAQWCLLGDVRAPSLEPHALQCTARFLFGILSVVCAFLQVKLPAKGHARHRSSPCLVPQRREIRIAGNP